MVGSFRLVAQGSVLPRDPDVAGGFRGHADHKEPSGWANRRGVLVYDILPELPDRRVRDEHQGAADRDPVPHRTTIPRESPRRRSPR